MDSATLAPPATKNALISLVRACSHARDPQKAELAAAKVANSGFRDDPFLCNLLIQMHGKCGDLEAARLVFDGMSSSSRSDFSWTILIAAYRENGSFQGARRLLEAMPEPNIVSINTVMACLVEAGKLQDAERLFWQMPLWNTCSYNVMLSAYGQTGQLQKARKVFDCMPAKDLVSWNTMVKSYAQHGHVDQAKQLFGCMPQWGIISWNTMVHAFAHSGNFREARLFLLRMPEWSLIAWNAMLSSSNGSIHAAENIFDQMPCTDIVTRNTMIKAYAKAGDLASSLAVFETMPEYDLTSITVIIDVCAQAGEVGKAGSIFGRIPRCDLACCGAMLKAYAQNGRLEEARCLFDGMGTNANVVSYSTLVQAYGESGHVDQAKELFDRMPEHDVVIWTSMLTAYAQNGHVEEVKDTYHAMPAHDCVSRTAALMAFAQNGHLSTAVDMFHAMPDRNLVSWTTMITACSNFGDSAVDATELFNQTVLEGLYPDHVSFTSLLIACDQLGQGWSYFISMAADYGIEPRREQYCCMLDLLGRTGHLTDAEELAYAMPFVPDTTVLGSLLAACRIHRDVERGMRVANLVFDIDPNDPTAHVLLSSIYAALGMKEEVAKVRRGIKEKGLRKQWLRSRSSLWIGQRLEVGQLKADLRIFYQ